MNMKTIPASFEIGKDRYSLAGLSGDYIKNGQMKIRIPPHEIKKIYTKNK